MLTFPLPGSEGQLKTVRMPKLIVSSKGAWCDWRELLSAYFHRLGQIDQVTRVQWLDQ